MPDFTALIKRSTIMENKVARKIKNKRKGDFARFYCSIAVRVTVAVMGTQSVAVTMTCPLIDEAAFAIGCMLNAFEVPAEAAMAKLPAGSVNSAGFVHVEKSKAPYNCPALMIVPLQVGPLNPARVTPAATMSWLCGGLRTICSCSR